MVAAMSDTSAERGLLVVTGSSAGGIEALSVVIGALPPDFRAPVVVAQHLDPSVPSSLAGILAKQTQLGVVVVNETLKLKPGTVYVVPSDRHVEITEGSVRVRTDGVAGRPKPSIDLLFASAAQSFGDRLIAVVLSGMGSDGSNGARAVKCNGGYVIIEDPMTASFPSMPASLEPGMVDVIAPLQEIGAEIVRLIDEIVELPDDDVPQLGNLLERVRAVNGIDFSHYKSATIKRRLARQMGLSGKKTVAEYLDLVDADPAEFGRLAGSFLIKVTEFFRDSDLFEELRTRIIPELVAEASSRGSREIRIWSAGCATGEEVYSLAILVAEALRAHPETFSVRIFATDIDDAAISFGRRGIYPSASIASLDKELLARYFVALGDHWEISKSLRALTVFGQHDLAQRAPFPRIDLALCRNVLIYFSKELQQRTLQIFAFSLRNGGYLALGKSETTNPLPNYFSVVNPTLRIFRRYGERVAIPSAQTQKPVLKPREVERFRQPFPAFEPSSRENRTTVNEKLGAFLTSSAIGVILVDRHYDIVSINPSARVMFALHGVAIGEDLVHLVPGDAAATLRSVLDHALRNEQPTAGGEEIELRLDGVDAVRYLSLSCYPEVSGPAPVSGAVILAVDVSELAEARLTSLEAVSAQSSEIEALRKAEAHARERQEGLLESNRQLAQAHSELRAQNDSLIISAEEAEAATEEIETLNEEMQATNEELETLNEEFQATIEELNTTNDEHEARGRELEAQLLARDAERKSAERSAAALASIVDGFTAALGAVDEQGVVVAANRAFREIQNGAPDSSVQIEDDSGARIPFSHVLRRAGEGDAFTFTYRSIAADQALTKFCGRVRILADNGDARAIVELAAEA
jgi:two-component system CheB/CheR fusion protein